MAAIESVSTIQFTLTELDKVHFGYGFRIIQESWIQETCSLSEILINSDLIEAIVDKWDTKNRVFRFAQPLRSMQG